MTSEYYIAGDPTGTPYPSVAARDRAQRHFARHAAVEYARWIAQQSALPRTQQDLAS